MERPPNPTNWASKNPAALWRSGLALNYLFETYPERVSQATERPVLQDWFVGQIMKHLGDTPPRELVADVVRERFASLEART